MKRIEYITILLTVCFVVLWASNGWAKRLKALFEEATQNYAQGKYDQAISQYEETLNIYPDFAPSYNFLALSYKAMGTDRQKVIKLFEKAIEIDPQYAPAYDNLGKVYYDLQDFDKAIQYCRKATELDPNLISAKLALAWGYLLGKSQPDEAIPYFQEVADNYHVPYAYLGLGMSYVMSNQQFKVLEMITQLRQLDNEDFALELERMVRDRNYLPEVKPGKPLFAPAKSQTVLIKELPDVDIIDRASENRKKMQVRLKKTNQQESHQFFENAKSAMTPEEQIRAMQERSRNNYSMGIDRSQ